MKRINIILLFFILCITFNIKALAASPDLVISGGELGTDYTYEDGVVSIINSNSYEVSMAEGVEESSDQIVINYSDTLKTINLTLNNVNLRTDEISNIRINYPPSATSADLKVNLILKGSNSLVASHHPYNNPRILGELIISSDGGSLTTEATEPPTDGYNNLNSAKVTLESGTVTMKDQIIMTGEGIYIKGGELNITSQDECLYSNGEIIISGGNTKLTSDSACAIHMVGKNISAASGGLQIIGDANLDITTNGTGSASIFAGNLGGPEDILIDTTGKVNIESKALETADSKAIGIILRNNSNLTVNNGTLNINGPDIGIYALQSAGSVFTVNGGETEITSKSYGVVLQSATQKAITFGDEYFHKNYHGSDMASRTEVSDAEVIKPNATSNKYVLITPAYTIDYDLGDGVLEEGAENPTKYTRIDTFTLNNPIPNDETATFIGWSGTDLEELTENVTISENSTGNRSYKANYTKDSGDDDEEEEPDNREDTDIIINPNTSFKYNPKISNITKRFGNIKTSNNNIAYIVVVTLSIISAISISCILFIKKAKTRF